tara:strand:- start:277 stop:534 length:258 start_codon:yes stop_codon:yes gene_type:complete
MPTSNFAKIGYLLGVLVVGIGLYRMILMEIEWEGMAIVLLGMLVIGVAFNWNKARNMEVFFDARIKRLEKDTSEIEDVVFPVENG